MGKRILKNMKIIFPNPNARNFSPSFVKLEDSSPITMNVTVVASKVLIVCSSAAAIVLSKSNVWF
jgi:hypothetical protein